MELVDEALPSPGVLDVYARTVVSGISHGTEMAWLNGSAAALRRSWDAERRMYCAGRGRDYPVAPGYESVGRVTHTGRAVTAVKAGDLIAIDAPHADSRLVSESTAAAGLLPAGLSPEQAIFLTLTRVALGGVHDASLSVGETVLVVGLGTVGLLAAQIARHGGCRVIGVDRYPLRLAVAETFGITAVRAGHGTDVAAEVRHLGGCPSGVDAAIEASGSYSGLHEAIRCLRVAGRVATVASYHGEQPGLRLGEEYHRNRITLISSMTVNDCAQRRYPLWTLDRLNHTARTLIDSGAVHTEILITHRIPFSHAADAYRMVANTPQETIKVVLTYGS